MPCACLLCSTQLFPACWRVHPHAQQLVLPIVLPHLGSGRPLSDHLQNDSVGPQSEASELLCVVAVLLPPPVAGSSRLPGQACSPSLPRSSLLPSAAPARLSASTCSAIGVTPSATSSTSTPSSWRSRGSAATSCCGRSGCAWQAGLPCTCRRRQLELQGAAG